MKRKSLKKKLGQNTAEYLIMLVLVAVGSIGMFSIFGQTLKKQLGNAVLAIRGDSDSVKEHKSKEEIYGILKKGTSLDLEKNKETIKMYNDQ